MSHSSTQTEAVEMSQVEVPMKERISLEPAGTTQTVVPEEPPRSTTKATEPSKSNKSHKKDKKKKKKKEPPPLPPYHIQPVEQVLEEFKSSTLGLQESEIAGRVTKYGKNELKGEGGVNPFILLLRHLVNGLTIILLIAAILSIVTEQWIETGKTF
jgi:magnesium-transporting ATPase (P-type)